MTIIWFIVWMVHGHPWVLSEWNPWNIALLVCAFFDNLGTLRVGAGPRPPRADVSHPASA